MVNNYSKTNSTTLTSSLVLLILIGLFSYGCSLARISSAPDIDYDKVKNFKIGTVTRTEVVDLLGEPFVVKEDAYIYKKMYTIGHIFQTELYVYFDGNGVVNRTLYVEHRLNSREMFKGISTFSFEPENFYKLIILKGFAVGETTIEEVLSLPYNFERFDIYENGRPIEYVLYYDTPNSDVYEPLDELPFIGADSAWLERRYRIGFTKDGILKPINELTGIFYTGRKRLYNGGILCVIACE